MKIFGSLVAAIAKIGESLLLVQAVPFQAAGPRNLAEQFDALDKKYGLKRSMADTGIPRAVLSAPRRMVHRPSCEREMAKAA